MNNETKDNITVEGITENYVWYHSKQLISKMQDWESQFERVVKVMESRHSEHLKMIDNLIMENKVLRSKLKEQNDNNHS